MGGAGGVLRDWWAALGYCRFWWRFGVLDIKLRYRRTVLGPFWVTLSFAVSAAALAVVYSTLFKLASADYLAYLVAGLAAWGLIAGLVTDGCATFTRHGDLIQQHRLPVLAHALRSVVAGLLVFLHNLLVVVCAVLLLRIHIGWTALLAVPALALVLANGLWLALLLGMLCARFRDLSQVIALLVNLAFFVTPVFWYRDMLGARGYIADFNPLFGFLEVLRSPLLGRLPPTAAVRVVFGVTILGWVTTLLFAGRFQRRLTYWL